MRNIVYLLATALAAVLFVSSIRWYSQVSDVICVIDDHSVDEQGNVSLYLTPLEGDEKHAMTIPPDALIKDGTLSPGHAVVKSYHDATEAIYWVRWNPEGIIP